ncbi:MAG TPA: hypothetical protein VL307_14960 [Chitinophagaceae bacterium]|nr:hypothetical protein [Chitinophagaceae bacterium]
MATAAFNDIIVQVHSNTNNTSESVRYYVRWFDGRNPLRELTFEYIEGHFLITDGNATEREADMLTHCIQALELSHAFRRPKA